MGEEFGMGCYGVSIKRYWRIVAAVCIAFVCWSGQARAAEAQEPIKVFVDLQRISFEVNPLLEEGTTLVQLRPLFEAMGLTLAWNEEKRLVTGRKEGQTIQLTIDEKVAYINGQPVELERAATIMDGNTLVPLRFIGEATGAYVAWDGVYREITVLSEQLMNTLKLTKEDLDAMVAQSAAGQQTEQTGEKKNGQEAEQDKGKDEGGKDEVAPAAPVVLTELEGMYYGLRSDWSGYECGGMCWDLYTFLPNDRVVIGQPKVGGPETIDCKLDTCYGYKIEQETMTLDDGDTYDIALSPEGNLMINGILLSRVDPAPANLKLDGTYVYRGFSGLIGINAFASSWQEWLTFYPDGTFESSNVTLGSLDTKAAQTNSSSSNEDKGTYSIKDNTITLKPENGTEASFVFFLHYDDPNDIQIGDRLFYVDDD